MVWATGVLLALPALAHAVDGGPTQISINDDFFDPDRATRDFETGPSFHWSRSIGSTNQHNVRQDDKLFLSGNPTTGPIELSVNGSAGSFHYYCEVHGSPSGGMDGVVRVRPGLDQAPDGRPFTVIWADVNTNTGGAFDVRFRVGSGDWRTWKNDTEKFQAVFGRNGKPIRVRPDKVYKFQARSEKASNHSKHSDWSPKLTVST